MGFFRYFKIGRTIMKKTKEDILWDKVVNAWQTDKSACALHYLEMYKQNFPDHIRCHTMMADLMVEFCQFDKARETLDYAWKLAGDDAKLKAAVAIRYGNLCREAGDHKQAVDWYKQAVAAHNCQDNLVILGTQYFQLGELTLACQAFEQAAALDECCADEAYFNLGSVYFVQQQFDKAEQCYQKSLKIQPDNPAAKAKLADLKELKTLK